MEKFDLFLNGGMGGGEVMGRDEGGRVGRESREGVVQYI